MPLIIVTGLPTSGKSHRAAQLHEYLAARLAETTTTTKPPYRLHLISDETLSIPRAVYDLSATPAHVRSANASEKDARATAYAAVKRVLSDRDVVILDGGNYIKGWRYQLHCEAKAVRTPSALLQVGCGIDRARAVNEARLRRDAGGGGGDGPAEKGEEEDEDEGGDAAEAYAAASWENLVFRYEEPNPMTRWDSPLFTLIWEDDAARAETVFAALWEAVAGEGRKAVRPNQATVQRSRDAGGDYLYVLDRETQDIVRRVLESQGDEGGGTVAVPRGDGDGDGRGKEGQLTVELPGRKLGLPQMQRHRRAFVGLNRGGIGLEGVGEFTVARMREGFVGYLNDAFEKEDA